MQIVMIKVKTCQYRISTTLEENEHIWKVKNLHEILLKIHHYFVNKKQLLVVNHCEFYEKIMP